LESFPDMLVRRINDSRSASNPSGRLGNVQLGNDVGEVLHTIPRAAPEDGQQFGHGYFKL